MLLQSDLPALFAERVIRRQAFKFVIEQIGLWWQRGKQRRALAQLNDRQLQDIGLSRLAAVREAAKPFWQP